MTRLSILAVFLCAGTITFGQSTPSGSGKPSIAPPAASPFPNFDQLPPNWRPGYTVQTKTFTQPGNSFNWESNDAQTGQTRHFNLTLPGSSFSSIPLMAQNYPSSPKIFNPHPEAKGEPIPTQWPNAKVEQLPTQWPNLKYSLIKVQPGASATEK